MLCICVNQVRLGRVIFFFLAHCTFGEKKQEEKSLRECGVFNWKLGALELAAAAAAASGQSVLRTAAEKSRPPAPTLPGDLHTGRPARERA